MTGYTIVWPCQSMNAAALKDRLFSPGLALAEQIAEDTCAKHNVFCCKQCFDMTEVVEIARWYDTSSVDDADGNCRKHGKFFCVECHGIDAKALAEEYRCDAHGRIFCSEC